MSRAPGQSRLCRVTDAGQGDIMTSDLESLKDTKTILLTTFKRDGAPVATPVSIAFDHDRAFFRSYDKAWKTQRLREAEIPAGKEVHAILDNLQVDKTPDITH